VASVSSVTSSPGTIRAKLAEVKKIEKSEGLPAAERAIIDILREGPQTHQGFIALARVLMKQQRFEDALRAAQKARAIAPLSAEPVIAAGFAHLRLNDNAAAASDFAAAIQLEPKSAHAHLGAAAVKLADENYDSALELCEKVINFDPDMERAHELIARINMKKGDKDQAIAELQSLIRKNSENRRAMRAYLRLMRTESRVDEALAFLEAEAEARPEDRHISNALVKAGAKLGRSEYATELYEKRVEDGESRNGDKVRYVMSLIEAGDYDDARKVIEELGSHKVLKPVVTKLHGDIALKSGNYEEALRCFQSACRVARIEMLDPETEMAATDPAERARLWSAHARKSLMSAIRSRRNAKD
jgi:tetratricopeptide (TPR) repeat protein